MPKVTVKHFSNNLLDESTSALDSVSEAQVLDQLLSHRQGKTTIIGK